MRILLILITLALIACQADPKPEEISQIVGQLISECPQAATDICQQIPQGADKNNQIGEVEIIDQQTAKLEWLWEWGKQRSETYSLTVSYLDSSWQPVKITLTEQMRREEEVIEIEPEIKVRFDKDLLTEAAYVVQFGSNGKQLIIKEIRGINEKSESEEIVLSTITADPTDWVVARGQTSEKEMKGDVTRLVRDYFTNYQAGNFAGLSQLAPDAANYHYQAELYLTDFEVKLPEKIKILAGDSEPQRAEISGMPITEPFSLLAQVPVKITYSLFGIEFNQDEKLLLTWSSDQRKWTMPFWGITKAVALAESINLGANTITLDGVATTHEATLIALTVTRHLPTTISIEGYQQKDDLLYFKLPRAFKWIEQLPKKDELMITIGSSPATPKTIKVNLNDQNDNPNPISGVQGRVEWGPTCGNPSSLDPDACGNIPYQATLIVTEPSGLVVANTASDANGLYRIQLPPGEYILIPESNEFMPASQINFSVSAGELTYIPIIYHSMIP